MATTGSQWDEVGAIAAVITMGMGVIGWGLGKSWEYWQSYWLSKRKCIKLEFDDIPPGRIHECVACPPGFLAHPPGLNITFHTPLSKCWEGRSSLLALFDRAWDRLRKYPKLVPVPPSWPASVPTLITDARNLVAFIICAAPGRLPFLHRDMRHIKMFDFEVRFYTLPGKHRHYAHIQGEIQTGSRKLTKIEIDRLVSGYPPWYREEFQTHDTTMTSLKFPIRNHDDFRRRGWVVAVGLMSIEIRGPQQPLPFYIARYGTENPCRLGQNTYFRDAVVRCRDHIRNNIHPHFADCLIVLEALEMLDYLIKFGTESGRPLSAYFEGPGASSLYHMPTATCDIVMKNFNEYSALRPNEVQIYRQNLLPVIAAVVHGALEIVQYLKDHSRQLILPDDFELDDEVFLVDCVSLTQVEKLLNKT